MYKLNARMHTSRFKRFSDNVWVIWSLVLIMVLLAFVVWQQQCDNIVAGFA